jgi:hypothetical protein
MPFSGDTAWPQDLLDMFEFNRNVNVTHESRYYGPYTNLLVYAFGNHSNMSSPRRPFPMRKIPADILSCRYTRLRTAFGVTAGSEGSVWLVSC